MSNVLCSIFPPGNNKTRDVRKIKDLVVRDYFENLLSSMDKLDSLRESQCHTSSTLYLYFGRKLLENSIRTYA